MNRETRRLMEREERRQKKEGKESRGQAAAARARRAGSAPTAEKVSLWRRLVNFLHEVRVEMRKVSWPTREQMIAFTAVTVITSTALTLIIFGLDAGLKEGVLWVIGETSG
jgi:preprotein translocase subunit SecE